MPSSYYYQIPAIVEYVMNLRPKSVLDIGIGFGKYGFLLREYLEVINARYTPDTWLIKIDGIDIYQPYILDTHKFLYNNIYLGEAMEIMKTLKNKYDLILAIDILEHFEKEEGVDFIKQCRNLSLNVLISTPNSIYVQGAVLGNVHETHRSFWNQEELKNLGAKQFLSDNHSILAIFRD